MVGQMRADNWLKAMENAESALMIFNDIAPSPQYTFFSVAKDELYGAGTALLEKTKNLGSLPAEWEERHDSFLKQTALLEETKNLRPLLPAESADRCERSLCNNLWFCDCRKCCETA